MKKYYFMTGLPRTGSLLMSTILNQNKEIYASPLSNLANFLNETHMSIQDSEPFRLGVMLNQNESLLKRYIDAFYYENKEKIIIDKSRSWGNPYFIKLLSQSLSNNPKIICSIRPLKEVVSSFILAANENPMENFIDKEMIETDFLPYWRKPIDDARTDWLLRPGGMIDKSILSVHSALSEENSEIFYVYSYSNFVKNPQKILDDIYDFLDIPNFKHYFNDIKDAENHRDYEVLGMKNLHKIRNNLEIKSPKPEEILSDYALSRCEIEDFWTNASLI